MLDSDWLKAKEFDPDWLEKSKQSAGRLVEELDSDWLSNGIRFSNWTRSNWFKRVLEEPVSVVWQGLNILASELVGLGRYEFSRLSI